MAYIPTEWHDGDIVTAEKLNKIEDALANLDPSGGYLTLHWDAEADMTVETYREVLAALQSGKVVDAGEVWAYNQGIDPPIYLPILSCGGFEVHFVVNSTTPVVLRADDLDGHLVFVPM